MQPDPAPLCREFLPHLSVPAAPEAKPPGVEAWATPELESVLQDMHLRAKERWPEVPLPRERYLSHLASLLAVSEVTALLEVLPKLCAADLYLACACADGVTAAVAAFQREYLGRVPTFVSRLRMAPAQLEDLQGALQERLLVGTPQGAPRIAAYKGEGNLLTFVRVASLRLGLNMLRDRGTEPQSDAPLPEEVVPPTAERAYLLSQYRAEFQTALSDAFAGLDRDRRQLLRLYYVDRLNTRDIARMFSVNPTTASRWVAEARTQVGQEVLRLLRERLKMDNTAVQSLYRMLRSSLNLNISTHLRSTPAS